MCICLHFLKLKDICQISDQSTELFMLAWTSVTSNTDETTWYNFASSTKSVFKTRITDCMSFIKTKIRIGPRTLPWRIPLVPWQWPIFCLPLLLSGVCLKEILLPMNVFDLWFHKPKLNNFFKRLLWGTLPNALQRSTTSTSFPLSKASVRSSRHSNSWKVHDFPLIKPCCSGKKKVASCHMVYNQP